MNYKDYSLLGSPPDWGVWGQMDSARLKDAVQIAMNLEPLPHNAVRGKEPIERWNRRRKSVKQWFNVALSAVCAGAFPILGEDRGENASDRSRVLLTEFARWAEQKGWRLPPKFPRSELLGQPQKGAISNEGIAPMVDRIAHRLDEASAARWLNKDGWSMGESAVLLDGDDPDSFTASSWRVVGPRRIFVPGMT